MSPKGQKIKVLIVDDHQVVRRGLRTFLDLNEELQVVGEAGDGATAVELAEKLKPDVILMDLVMPVMDGITAITRIKSLELNSRVIALTSFAEEDKIFPAIQAGACSYLLKDVSPEALVEAIHAARDDESRLHPQVMRKLMDQVAQQAPGRPVNEIDALTGREREVLQLVAQGKSNREIAAKLVISEKTAKAHISNILGKLGLKDRTQLAIYALQNNLADREKA